MPHIADETATPIGTGRLSMLFEETVAVALTDHHITKKKLAQVIVDPTVPEKNITRPTDSKL